MSLRIDSETPPGRPAAGMLASAALHRDSNGNTLHAPVLVLNASYEPINVCAARRALVLVLKGVAMTEEENGHFLHAARVAMRVPSVIRLLEYRRIPHQSRALSRKNILLRPQHLPVLQHHASLRRTYAGSRDSTLARRTLDLGEPRRLLSSLQSPQRQPASPRSQHEAHA